MNVRKFHNVAGMLPAGLSKNKSQQQMPMARGHLKRDSWVGRTLDAASGHSPAPAAKLARGEKIHSRSSADFNRISVSIMRDLSKKSHPSHQLDEDPTHVKAESTEEDDAVYDYAAQNASAMKPKNYSIIRNATSILDVKRLNEGSKTITERQPDHSRSSKHSSFGNQPSVDSMIIKHTAGIEHVPQIRSLVKDYNEVKSKTKHTTLSIARKLSQGYANGNSRQFGTGTSMAVRPPNNMAGVY